LLTVKKAEKSLKKRDKGQKWNNMGFQKSYSNIQGRFHKCRRLKKYITKLGFLICWEKIICWAMQNILLGKKNVKTGDMRALKR
jgi:hypothetical protein